MSLIQLINHVNEYLNWYTFVDEMLWSISPMLLIPHYIGPSSIDGLGCFSSVDVTVGEKIWEVNPIIDRIISKSELESLPQHISEMVQKHAEFLPFSDEFRLSLDGAYFMNHSDAPNLEIRGDYASAKVSIKAGEELTCDYREAECLASEFLQEDGVE